MVSQELITYITEQLKQGVARGQITSNLLAQGWRESDIAEVFVSLEAS